MAVIINPQTGSFGWVGGAGQIDSINATSETSWEITLASDGKIDISAADGGGFSGDVFSLSINGSAVPWTSTSYPGGFFVGHLDDYVLPAGTHTITLIYSGPNGDGSNTDYSFSAVTFLNVPPDAANDTGVTNEDAAVLLDVRNNDTDGNNDPLTITAASVTAGLGSVGIVDGKLSYDPAMPIIRWPCRKKQR